MNFLLDKFSKKYLGYTPEEILKIKKKSDYLKSEFNKIPLLEKYKFGILGCKGFCLKESIFKEKDIDNSYNKIPTIDPLSINIAIVGDSGSGKSFLSSKVLSSSKKILHFGAIDKEYYPSNAKYFEMLPDKETVTFNLSGKSIFSHEIFFSKEDKIDMISIRFETIFNSDFNSDNYLQTYYSMFETLIFKAIKNGYSIHFEEEFFRLDIFFKTDKFSELVAFAHDRLKLEIDQLKIQAIDNDAKIVMSLQTYTANKTLFSNLDCSYYIDELILMRNIKAEEDCFRKNLPSYINDYFNKNPISEYRKINYIQFEKIKEYKSKTISYDKDLEMQINELIELHKTISTDNENFQFSINSLSRTNY